MGEELQSNHHIPIAKKRTTKKQTEIQCTKCINYSRISISMVNTLPTKQAEVGTLRTHQWLHTAMLKAETDSCICSAQEQCLLNRN